MTIKRSKFTIYFVTKRIFKNFGRATYNSIQPETGRLKKKIIMIIASFAFGCIICVLKAEVVQVGRNGKHEPTDTSNRSDHDPKPATPIRSGSGVGK